LLSFSAQEWWVSELSDRVGTRLVPINGQRLEGARADLLSFGVVRGAIQLPPGGEPVILNVDHQTTGGYPIIGVVCQADWPKVAQLAPGQRLAFEVITLAAAAEFRREERQNLGKRLQHLAPKV
jgi:antagonist of KipI